MDFKLSELLDLEKIQHLMELFYSATGIDCAILNIDAEVLVASGWQDMCTRFHRKHPECSVRCTESDNYIKQHLHKSKYVQYKCANGLWDVAFPILLDGEHIATFFFGQFFYEDEKPDIIFFKDQAKRFGFNEKDYLDALEKVPVFSRSKVRSILDYYSEFVSYITETALNALKQKQSEHLYHMLVETSPDVIVVTDKEGYINFVSEQVGAMFGGVSKDSVIGTNVIGWVASSDRPRAIENLSKVAGGEYRGHEEYQLLRNDGTTFYGDVNAVCMRDSDNNITELMYSVRDVTESNRVKMELQKSESRLASASSLAHVGHWEWQIQKNTLYWSDETLKIFGFAPGEIDIDFDTFISLVDPDDVEIVQQKIQTAIETGCFYDTEIRFLKKSGESRIGHAIGEVFYSKDGQPVLMSGSMQDITELREAEQQLRDLNAELENRVNERTLELQSAINELESFSYSVSHDLRTPLRAIDGFSQILLEEYGDKIDDIGKSYLNRVRDGSHKMSEIIDDMIMLSRVARSDLQKKDINLSEMAENIIYELKAGEPDRQVDIYIEPDMRVYGDPYLMKIVIHNLLDNAWKFTAKKETAYIEFKTTTIDGKNAFVIKDNGIGFDMKYISRLFGAYQKLHSSDEFKGTGIGLATVKRIVKKHGGNIWAVAEQDIGASFFFTL